MGRAVTVYLVGAGPGDPGLLTVRGAEVLRHADVVVYDRLSVASLLDLAPAGAERIGVGKAPGRVTMAQAEICALLVERGAAGQQVVRLKGGDPFVFARGGEEAAAPLAAGVAFEVVPGITSALAVPAYAGIPVTLRHSSTSFTVVTGHEDPSRPDGSVDWEAVARVGGTIVVLMGVARWERIAARPEAGGRAPSTPVAAIQWGTRPEQRTVRSTLGALRAEELASPSVIVIGEVAAQELTWFERRPLFGTKVVVTRAREQASELVDRLRSLGAETIELPAISIGDPADGGASLRAAVDGVAGYDWVVFTSVNGVERFFAELPDTRALGGVRVAAIGPGTADALARYRVVADLVPDRFVAEALLDAFPPPPTGDGGRSRRVLLARAAIARDVLPDGLRAAGWAVDVVEAYRTRTAEPTEAELAAAEGADAITFTASSTVTRYLEAAGAERVPPVVACIGPVTAAAARDHGLTVAVEAGVHTVDGLVDALVAHLGRPAGGSGLSPA
ncbi:uroporphyrinogen-III C-methyltransferase [soil metagenome]